MKTLIVFAFFVVGFFSSAVHAQTASSPYYDYSCRDGSPCTVQQATNSYCAYTYGPTPASSLSFSGMQVTFNCTRSNGTLVQYPTPIGPRAACPAGQAHVSSTGACSVPAPQCSAGTKSTFDSYTGSGPLGSTKATVSPRTTFPSSDGTCNVTVDTVESCYSQPSVRGQDFFCTFSGTRDGSVTPPSTTPPDPTPSLGDPTQNKPAETGPKSAGQGQSCPDGTVSLGIDSTGGMICGGKGTSPTTPTKTEVKQPTQTVTNADGSTTKTDVTTRSNSDGSSTTTTTTTTTGTDGKVTSTTTQTTSAKPASSGGGAGKSDSGDDKKNDLCTQHPELNICKNSTVTGTCESTACEGDAIQCAILQQERKQYCELSKQNDISSLGDQVLKGNDPVKDPFATATPINVNSFDSSDLFGAHQCPANADIQLWEGNSFSISFKPICDFAGMVRPFVISGAAAGALWFVFGGI